MRAVSEILLEFWESEGTDLRLWRRSRVRTLALRECLPLIAVLAFSSAWPPCVVPAYGAVYLYVLDRFGFTFLGKAVAFVLAVLGIASVFRLLVGH